MLLLDCGKAGVVRGLVREGETDQEFGTVDVVERISSANACRSISAMVQPSASPAFASSYTRAVKRALTRV
ncbi:hypothetical protein [Streptomyces sp. NPDC059862]|uniref:hypothetical protein n=1 Tax=unclassified Streptomyces TaxID=2593676 RepID=UPI003632B4C8